MSLVDCVLITLAVLALYSMWRYLNVVASMILVDVILFANWLQRYPSRVVGVVVVSAS
jgi:hypothetical protein